MHTHPVSLKQQATFIFSNNFGKIWPIFIIFTLLNSERICRGAWIKTTTSSQTGCRTTLQKVSGKLYSFTFILARILSSCQVAYVPRVFICLIIFPSWHWRYYDIIVTICLLHYSCLTIMKINVRHSIDNGCIHWPVVCMTQNMHMCFSEGGHFKHMW